MASTDRSTSRHDGEDETYVAIVKVRTCQRAFGRRYCTPRVKESAHVHLGPGPAERLANGVTAAAEAIATTMASTGVGAPAAPWLALAGGLVLIGYHALKNNDGSIDIYIDNVRVRAGSARIPVHIGSPAIALILQSM